MRTHILDPRVLAALLAVPAIALCALALLSGGTTPASATPDLPSATSYSGARTPADRQFLRESFFDD